MDTLRKLQLIELEILKKVHKICIENNIKYYIIGGTLLGAVRHGGFIPWDDDVDIVMYREDMNKLIKILQEEYSNLFFVQNFDTDPYYVRYITKIRLNGTKLVEPVYKDNNAVNGIYIDIFPLDHVPQKDSFDLRFRGTLLRYLLAIKSIKFDGLGVSKSKAVLGKILKVLLFFIPDKTVNNLFKYVFEKDNNKDCPYTTNFSSHFKWKKQLFENNVYGEGVLLDFENSKFIAPNKYTEVLERLYGKNYMDLPPKEKRENHNIYELDLGKYEENIKLEE